MMTTKFSKCTKLILSALFLQMLVGCGAVGYSTLRSENRAKLMKLEVGMTKDQVIAVMGVKGYGEVSNPFKREVIPGPNGEIYDVLYYYTEFITYEKNWEEGVTPVVMKSDKVLVWGWKFLDDSDFKKTVTIKNR